MKIVPVGVSARHIHLTRDHIDQLFGPLYELTPFKWLSQPGQFAAQETVKVFGPKGVLERVRIIGPARRRSQLEISRTDSLAIGVDAPLRESGNLSGTPGIRIAGPIGEIELEDGVILAARHIHFHTSEAERWGITDRQLLTVRINSERPLVLENVLARVSDHYSLDMHIDTDEGNAALVKTGDYAILLD
jgi:putative phosphotransacetylase